MPATVTECMLFPPRFFGQGPNGNTINSSTAGVFGAYMTPKAGNLSAVGVYVMSVTSPPVLAVQIQGVDSNRRPNGVVATSTSFTPVVGYQWVTLASPLAVTAGQAVSAVIAYASGTVGASNNVNVAWSPNIAINFRDVPQSGYNNGGGWNSVNIQPSTALRYDDGTIIPGGQPGTVGELGIPNGNLGELATVFTAPYNAPMVGATFVGYLNQVGSKVTITLYDTGNTALATTTLSVFGTSIGVGAYRAYFVAPPTLVAGTQYRLAIAVAAGSVNPLGATWPSTSERDQTAGAVYHSARSTAGTGAWTDTPTVTPGIIPLLGTPLSYGPTRNAFGQILDPLTATGVRQ